MAQDSECMKKCNLELLWLYNYHRNGLWTFQTFVEQKLFLDDSEKNELEIALFAA